MSPFTSIKEAVLAIRQRWYAWRTVRKLRKLHRNGGVMPMSDRQIEALFAAEEAALGPRTVADDLCDAARDGNLDEVTRLLAGGASPSAENRRGQQPLYVTEEVEVMRLLLQAGATVDREEGWTLLHMWVDAACDVMHQLRLSEPKPDHLEILRLLLAHGANPDLRHADTGTALDMARHYGCAPVIRMLEEHRARRGRGIV